MTMGYRTDDLALRALLGKEFRYLGLLGSKTKIQKMMDTYNQEGLNTITCNGFMLPSVWILKVKPRKRLP